MPKAGVIKSAPILIGKQWMNNLKLSRQERQSAISLALVYAFRMMGLFMLLPVLALYANDIVGGTPMLAGLAVGMYGLTQAVLQIPFGLLSDQFGRKPVIYGGLCLFALGSLLAALAGNVYMLIVARALQGAGAIAAAIMALAADLSRETQRAKVMGIIGASIGASFLLSLMLGPLLSSYIGVAGLFWLAFAFALIGIIMIAKLVPNPVKRADDRKVDWQSFKAALFEPQLLALNLSIFMLHALLTALFIWLPFVLVHDMALPKERHWQLYLPVMLASLLIAAPMIMQASKLLDASKLILTAIAVAVTLASSALWVYQLPWLMIALLLLFFVAFNLLESALPAQVSKTAADQVRGAALGVYSSSQFMGSFVGAMLAGVGLGKVLQGALSYAHLGVCVGCVGACWLVTALLLTYKK